MSLSTKDITVILACQNQGRFVNPSIKSAEAAIQKAESELGLSIEWIIATDSPSPETQEYLQYNLPARARNVLTKAGHLSAAKNQAVQEAAGKFIATLEGDDLVATNWLCKAHIEGSARPTDSVYHPGMVVVFGQRCFLFIPPDHENPDFTSDMLFAGNSCPGVAYAAREIFCRHPFSQPGHSDGFGYPDWHWVCETAADGILHKPVKGTFSCCHQKPDHSCVVTQPDHCLLMPPSKLFQLLPEPMKA